MLSNKKISIKEWKYFSKEDIDQNIYMTMPVANKVKSEWVGICTVFCATGDEKYLTIGFGEFLKKEGLPKNKELKEYFFIDDVSLVELGTGDKCQCRQDTVAKDVVKTQVVPTSYDSALGKPFVLNNIIFELNKAQLQSSSFAELGKLVKYLKENPKYKIELSGHTDNVGKEADNLKLSKGRAKSVADYLIQNGIQGSRISYEGYGSGKPRADNKTEAGREQNRRVEMILK